MHLKLLMAVFVAALASTGGGACAMTKDSSASLECTVGGSEKFVAAAGGADAICAIMEKAIAATGLDAAIHVEILSSHAAVAHATIGGRNLDQRRIDISDRTLNGQAIETLARAVVDQLTAHIGTMD
jgi:hypothetical protein